MFSSLIKLLEQNGSDKFCNNDDVTCSGVFCCECPFYNEGTLFNTIENLKKAQEKQDV